MEFGDAVKVALKEHDGRLEMVVTAETYEEHMLVNAFIREQEHEAERRYQPTGWLPISDNPNGHWSLTLGSCECRERMRRAEKAVEPPAPCKHKNIAACSDLSLECQDCGVTVDLDGVPVKS